MKVPAWVGVVLALIRHYISSEVIDVLKAAIFEAWAHGEWQEGERTEFVIAKARELADATPTKWDDLLVEMAARLYIRKYLAEGRITAAEQ